MTYYFSLISSIFFFFQIALFVLFFKDGFFFFSLYRSKVRPDYPLSAKDTVKFLNTGGTHFFKFFLAPFFMWRLILTHHKNKELNDAAKRIRLILILFIGSIIIETILIILTTPHLHFQWG